MFSTTLKNMNLYIDGKGYAGVIEEITLPKLTLKSEEFRGGGMDAPIKIDMGMEHLETGFTLKVFDKSTLTHYVWVRQRSSGHNDDPWRHVLR
ncbi:MAG: hypothetical protein HamCj_07970 [Candidatus Hamiltonella defensa (Ceratovacuna japonica)]